MKIKMQDKKGFRRRIECALEESNLNEKDLWRKIASELKLDVDGGYPHFTKMMKAKHSFNEAYIPYLEKYLNKSYMFFVTGEMFVESDSFLTLRTVASKDNTKLFEELDVYDGDLKIFERYDEFDKTIIDYCIQFKSINGFKYLFEHEYLVSSLSAKKVFSSIDSLLYLPEDIFAALFDVACESDDRELFEKVCSDSCEFLKIGLKDKLNQPSLITKIVKTENIFDSIFEPEECSFKELNFGINDCEDNPQTVVLVSPFASLVLNYLIKNYTKYDRKLSKALDRAIKTNESILEAFNKEYRYHDDATVNSEGDIVVGHAVCGNLITSSVYQEVELPEDIANQLEKLERIISDFKFRDKEHYRGSTQIVNGRTRIANTGLSNMEDFYKFVDNQAGLPFIPRLLSKTDNYYELTTIRGAQTKYGKDLNEKFILSMANCLSELDDKSSIVLDGRVYWNRGLDERMILSNNNEVVGIIDWSGVRIGERYTNLIILLTHWARVIDQVPTGTDEAFQKALRVIDKYFENKPIPENLVELLVLTANGMIKDEMEETKSDEFFICKYAQTIAWLSINREKIRLQLNKR